MLETGRPAFGSFADFNGPESSRLYVSIADASEVVYLGLSPEYDEDGMPFEPFQTNFANYRFQIVRDVEGGPDVVVHGPFTVTTANANANSWSQALYGQYSTANAMYVFNPPAAGDYYIQFDDVNPNPTPNSSDGNPWVNIPFWDITVTNGGIPIDGRVWSRNWAFRTPPVTGDNMDVCLWDRQFKGTLYSYTTDNFVSRIDFAEAGFQGLSFNVAFNTTGPTDTSDLVVARQSIPDFNATGTTAEHRVFLSEPDPVLFPSPIENCGQLSVLSSFSCLGADSFCIQVAVTKPGQVEVIIDFDQNNMLDSNSQDLSLLYEFAASEFGPGVDSVIACIPWDGIRGDGTPISPTDTVNLVFTYSQGIQHWSVFDVELLQNGFCVETIRPQCSPELNSRILYWDDRNIPVDPGTGVPKDARNGFECDSGTPRSWSNFNITFGQDEDCEDVDDSNTDGYGDKATLNTWWFANTTKIVEANIPLVTAQIVGIDSICSGEVTTFTALDEGATGTVLYNWSGPNGFTASTASIDITEEGEYCVTISDSIGCESSTCRSLTVLGDGDSPITYDTDRSACVGELVTLEAMGDTSDYTFSWMPEEGLNDPMSASPSFIFTAGTSYTVEITSNITTCTTAETITIEALTASNAAFTSEAGCEQGLEVDFIDQSVNAAQYSWDFGDPNTTADVSDLASPSYTYPEAGIYTVSLTTTSADGCTDMVTQEVVVVDLPLIASFDATYANCDRDSVVLQLTNTSINALDNTTGFIWQLSTGQSSSLENPTFTFFADTTVTVTLTIFTDDNCSEMTSQEMTIRLSPPDQFPDALLVCVGDSVQISPAGDPSYQYFWSPATGLDDPTSPAPTFYPDASTTYVVAILAIGVDTCMITESIEVNVPAAINLSVSGDGVICADSTTLVASTDVAAEIEWQNTNGDSLASGNEYTVAVSGSVDYVAVATDADGCMDSETVTVSGGSIDVVIPDTVAVCLGDEIVLMVQNLDPNDTLSYLWTPVNLFEPGTETTATPDYIEAVGEEIVTIELTSQYDCTLSEEIVVAVVDTAINLSFTSVVDCNGSTVIFTNTSTNAFGYVWDFGDGSPLDYSENPTHTYLAAGTWDVTLSIVYDVDCVMDFTAQVTTQEPQIIADFSYDLVECSPDSAKIQLFDQSTNTFNNTVGWEWNITGAVPTFTTEQNPMIMVYEEGTVEVSLTILTENNCSNTTTQLIDVVFAEVDIIELVDTLVLCQGDTVQLNVNGDPDLVYDWQPAAGLSDPTAVSPFAFPDVTTTYIATAYTTAGSDTCFVSDTLTIFVPETINLDLGPDVVTTCGEDVLINATADVDLDDLTLTWASAVEGPLGTGNFMVLNPFRTDTIIVVAEDQYGCMDSDTVIINDLGVDIEIDPGTNIIACEGVDTTLTVMNLDSQDTLTYSWTPLENIISGATDSTVTILVEDPGTVIFTVIVNNQMGCADTVDVSVTIQEFQGEVPDTVFACINEPTPLNPDGNSSYIYNWEPTTGLDLSDPSNPLATLSMDQTYFVTITDNVTGCVDTDTLEVIIHPVINLMTTGDTTLCEVEDVTLTATTNFPVPIEWFDEDGNSIDTGSPITVTPEVGVNTYLAVATDTITGCVDSSTVVVEVLPQLELMTTGGGEFCRFMEFELTATTSIPADIEWYNTDTLVSTMGTITVVPDMVGDNIWTVIATDPITGCSDTSDVVVTIFPQLNLVTTGDTSLCEVVPVILTATTDIPTAEIEWYFEGDNIDSGSPITVIPPGDGDFVYTAIATDPATMCMDTSEVTVKVQLFDEEVPNDTIVCADVPTSINPGGDPELVYVWSPMDEHIDLTDPSNPVITTNEPLTYTVTVTDPIFGCVVIDTVNIDVYPIMNLTVGEDIILCVDESVTLTATTDFEPAMVTWYQLPDNNEIGTGTSIDFNPPLGTTLVYAEAISGDGCPERDTLQLDNYPIDATITSDLLFCVPQTTTELEVMNNDPSQELTIVWSPTESIVTDPATGPIVTVDPNVDPANVDIFTAIVTNQYGCSQELTTTVTVVDLEGILGIEAVPDTIVLGESTTITVSGCVGCDYEWFPPSGDVSPPDGAVVTATPTESGDQLYEVTVSLLGCMQDLAVNVFVFDAICDGDHVFLPNAFSPNNDGRNDELRVRSVFLNDIIEYELMIYNRWGEELFRSRNQFEAWDGTFRGKQLPPDVYGFYLRVICPDEEELIQKGNITILR